MNVMQMLTGMTGMQNGNNIMAQAMQAMMRGESPQAFMNGLIANNPCMNGMNVQNLQETATKLCNERNINVSDAVSSIKQQMNLK